MMAVDLTGTTQVTYVDDEVALRELVGSPSERAVRKQLPALDQHAKAFIAASPFALLATSGADGSCDVSPRGDGPGFVLVLDERTLAIPDRPGNRRTDSLRNILQHPEVGLIFLVPGMEETLRVNGRARIVREARWMDTMVVQGKRPTLAVLVEVDEAFFHCAKAFRRSRRWQPETWPDRASLPTLGQMLKDQLKLDQSAVDLDCSLEEAYQKTLY
jgi:PPOX class probable FMN-dependent enzyme